MSICCAGNTDPETVWQSISLPHCSSAKQKYYKLLLQGISVSLPGVHLVWNSDFCVIIMGSNSAALIQSKLSQISAKPCLTK